jgi:hypothetical protein
MGARSVSDVNAQPLTRVIVPPLSTVHSAMHRHAHSLHPAEYRIRARSTASGTVRLL